MTNRKSIVTYRFRSIPVKAPPAGKQGKLRRLVLSLALLGWPSIQYAQLLQDAPEILTTEAALNTILYARNLTTEIELRRLSLQLLEMSQTMPAPGSGETDFRFTGLKLPAAGQADSQPALLPAGSDLTRLPGILYNRRDASGQPIAYCAFDARGFASTGRLAGRVDAQGNPTADAVSLVIVSPGNNGQFEFRCSDFRNLLPGDTRVPSFPIAGTTRGSDDVVYVLTHAETTYSGRQSQNMGAAVETYANLLALNASESGGSVSVSQIRWVRQLNQFFVATTASAGGSTWQPLTPSMRISVGDTFDSRAQFSWLSGGIGVGSDVIGARAAITGIDNAERTASLTLGSRRLQPDAQTWDERSLAPGIALRDSLLSVRAYVGLSGDNDTSFAIRHLATTGSAQFSDRLRISADGRLWLGDVPATSTPVARGTHGIFGSLHVGTDGSSSTTSPAVFIGNVLQNQTASLRFWQPLAGQSPIFELGATDGSGNTANGHMVLRTLGNVGIGMDGTTAATTPQYRLDVAGTGRFAGELALRPLRMTSGDSISLVFADPDGGTGPARITYRDTGTPNLEISAALTLLSSLTSAGAISATGGLATTTGSFSGGILATTGGFSGVLNAGAGIITTTGSFSGGIVASTGDFNDRLTASGGLAATTGTFSGNLSANNGLNVNGAALNANAGLVSTTGSFSEGLSASGGLNAATGSFTGLLNASGGLAASTGSFTGTLQANGGLAATTGLFSAQLSANGGLSATTGTFTGSLQANGGLTGTTATFSGLVTANAGLDVNNVVLNANAGLNVRGPARFFNGITVDGDSVFNGSITVNGRIIAANTVAMQFFGYSGPGNSNPRPIGNATLDINTGALRIDLAQANENLYTVDQNLSAGARPSFNGLNIASGGIASSGVILTTSSFQGYLDGTSRDANKLNKTLRLNFRKNDGEGAYATVDFDLRDDSNFLERTITVNSTPSYHYGNIDANAFSNVDNRSVSAHINNPHITYNVTCTINGSAATQCEIPQNTFTVRAEADRNSFLAGNSYIQGSNNNVSGPTENIAKFDVTNNYSGGTATVDLARQANRLTSPITLQLRGSFFNDANVSFNAGETQTLTLTSRGLDRATAMNQDVRTDSAVTFNQLTVRSARVNEDISAGSLQVSGPATVRSLSVVNSGGTRTVSLDGDTSSAAIGAITLNGSDSSITANRFIGTADRATRLAQDLSFTFNGVISGTSSTVNGFNYTLTTSLADNSIDGGKLRDAAVTTNKLADASVSSAKLLDAAVTTAKIADGAVTAFKLADGSVTNSKLADGAVSTIKLADAAVTTAKIGDAQVTEAKLSQDVRNKLSETSSDARLKSNITRVDGSHLLQRLSMLMLHGYQFTDDPLQERKLGVLAQELQPLFPELVSIQTSGAHAGYFAVNYGALGGIAAAGVGELNRKLDTLGLRLKSADTLQAALPNFAVTRIEGNQAKFNQIEAEEISAKQARFERLDAQQFTTDRSRTRQLQAETVNSGSVEGYGMGSGLMLFQALADGHYLVQVSASDGSFATATVFVSGGNVSVVPTNSNNISIMTQTGFVYAFGPGKLMKATWLRTG